MTQKNSSLATGPIVEKFRQFETASRPPKWLAPLRKAGIASFADQGFPTLHDEDWRFTNVAPIVKLPFHLAGEVAVNGAESKAHQRIRLRQAARPAARVRERIFLGETFAASSRFPAARGLKVFPPRWRRIPRSSKNISANTRTRRTTPSPR